jgi:hypothetical protein
MRLARRRPHRDQPSIGIGEIPPYSDPNFQQRRQGQLVPEIGGFCACALALTASARTANANAQAWARGSAQLAPQPRQKLSNPLRLLRRRREEPRHQAKKNRNQPAGCAFYRWHRIASPDDRCAIAPSSPQAQGADDGQGASPPPERRPFCAPERKPSRNSRPTNSVNAGLLASTYEQKKSGSRGRPAL